MKTEELKEVLYEKLRLESEKVSYLEYLQRTESDYEQKERLSKLVQICREKQHSDKHDIKHYLWLLDRGYKTGALINGVIGEDRLIGPIKSLIKLYLIDAYKFPENPLLFMYFSRKAISLFGALKKIRNEYEAFSIRTFI